MVLPDETILRVNGEGTVYYKPEILTVSIGVTTSDDTAKGALLLNNEKSARLVEAIRAAGIPAKDIKTTELSVEPQFSEDEESDTIIGWRATNRLTVKTGRIDDSGKMIALLFEAGGNTLDGPEFGLSEQTRLEAKRAAEAKALEEARDQAEATARVLGMRLARTLLISDSRVNFDRSGGYIVVTGSRKRSPMVPIEPGEIEVTASYSIEYALAPD